MYCSLAGRQGLTQQLQVRNRASQTSTTFTLMLYCFLSDTNSTDFLHTGQKDLKSQRSTTLNDHEFLPSSKLSFIFSDRNFSYQLCCLNLKLLPTTYLYLKNFYFSSCLVSVRFIRKWITAKFPHSKASSVYFEWGSSYFLQASY